MIKKPFILVQIFLVSFVLSYVTERSDLTLIYPMSTAIGIAIITVGLVAVGNALWYKFKKYQPCQQHH